MGNRKTRPRTGADLLVGSAGAAHSQADAIAAENQYGATHQVDVAVQLEKFVLQAQALRIHDVIAIHASEKLARAQADGFIQARSEAAILACSTSRIRESANRRTISAVPSVEPSSMTISSQPVNCWASTDSIARATVALEFLSGIPMLMIGMVASVYAFR